jgi:hypothetical protein
MVEEVETESVQLEQHLVSFQAMARVTIMSSASGAF